MNTRLGESKEPSLLVRINPRLYESTETYTVNLHKEPWSSLLPEGIREFGVEEICRPNNVYPDGLLPGSQLTGDGCITTKVNVFPNYLEWSKVTEDDVVQVNNDYHVTSRFFESRASGWERNKFKSKPGNVIGYIFNGVAYHIQDTELVEDIVYTIVYKSILKGLPLVKGLQERFTSGTSIEIVGSMSNGLTIKILSDILNETPNSA